VTSIPFYGDTVAHHLRDCADLCDTERYTVRRSFRLSTVVAQRRLLAFLVAPLIHHSGRHSLIDAKPSEGAGLGSQLRLNLGLVPSTTSEKSWPTAKLKLLRRARDWRVNRIQPRFFTK
jgi:hypothetical protein